TDGNRYDAAEEYLSPGRAHPGLPQRRCARFLRGNLTFTPSLKAHARRSASDASETPECRLDAMRAQRARSKQDLARSRQPIAVFAVARAERPFDETQLLE